MTAPLTVSRPELLRRKSDEHFRLFVHRLLAFSARLQSIRDSFGEHIGLSGVQYSILVTIAHLDEDDGVSVKDIANHLALSGAFITIETGKLEKNKLVTKKKNPRDGRAVLVKVTPEGNALLADLAPMQVDVNDTLFASLTREDFDRISELLPKMVRDADRACAIQALHADHSEAG